MPLVSVIMNVRNGAAFLRQALDSAIAQTFQDWELIVWDDRSTDDSASIITTYRDPRIRYFLSPQDTPLGTARDNAIRQAGGHWLAFLDQDDVWLPYKLEEQLALAADGVGIIYGRTVRFEADRKLRDYDYTHEFTVLPEGDIFAQLFADGCFIAMSSAILLRSAVLEIGGIPSSVEVVPDYYLYVALAHRYQARAVQEVICLYRVHAGNLTRSHDPRLHAEPLWLIDQWKDRLDQRIVRYRRMTYSTALAVDEVRRGKIGHGLVRLFTQGSVVWLLWRPFVHAWRALMRTIRRPYWCGPSAQTAADETSIRL